MKRTYVFVVNLVLLGLMSQSALAQLVNGSFEEAGQPSMAGWSTTCNDALLVEDAAPGGGDWAIKVAPGNLQDCYPGRAYQTLPGMQTGEIWRVSVWTKRMVNTPTVGSVYLRILGTSGERSLAADTSTAAEWTLLTVMDTLYLETGDSVQVVLDAGLTSGPTIPDSGFLFDLVEASRVGPVSIGASDGKKTPGYLSAFPNPLSGRAVVRYVVPESAPVALTIYDLLGRQVRELASGRQPAGTYEVSFDAAGLPSGIYFYRLQAGDYVETKRMVIVK